MFWSPVSLLDVSSPGRATGYPRTESWSWPSGKDFPWPRHFAPPTPHQSRLSGTTLNCSFASALLLPRPTSYQRTCWAFGHKPSPTGPVIGTRCQSPVGSPGFRADSVYACIGSYRLRRVRWALAVSRPSMLPSPSVHKVGTLKFDFGAQYRAYILPCQRLALILTNQRP